MMSDMGYYLKECFLCNDDTCLIANLDEDGNEVYDISSLQVLCTKCAEKQSKNIKRLDE